MKTTNPFLNALCAGVYIVFIVFVVQALTTLVLPPKTVLIPIAMLSLFVLSAAVMGFLFVYEPLKLYLDGQKDAALKFFGKTVGFFALLVAIFFLKIILFAH